jgi:hypothetical protein
MTNDTMDLQALVGKSPDADFLRDMIGFAPQRLMALLCQTEDTRLRTSSSSSATAKDIRVWYV